MKNEQPRLSEKTLPDILPYGLPCAIIILMARENGDITRFKVRESKLTAERLEKMSHDFRTPLNIIIGFTELLLEEVPGKINDEQRRSLNDILQSSQRLLKLVNNIIDQSIIDS